MIIFFTGLNSTYEKYMKALNSFQTLDDTFPELKSAGKFSYCSDDCKNFIFLIWPENESSVKSYFAEDEEHILFYSGLPIDISGTLTAHNAKDFLAGFDHLKYNYEGQASIIRYNKKNKNADIITDILGIDQVYYLSIPEELLLSNHVGLIEKTAGINKLDLAGASHFLSIGWVGQNLTLKENIHLIGGAEHWEWNGSEKSVTKNRYFDFRDLRPASKDVLNKQKIESLYLDMENCLDQIGNYFNLECPLTGGYDSRLVTALLMNKGLHADYYTAGSPEHKDVIIASEIASMFKLPYKVYEIDYEQLSDNWDSLLKELILKNNGMASLWQIFNLLTHQDEAHSEKTGLTVRLTTHGAEAARASYNRTFLWNKKIKEKDVFVYLTQRTLENPNLLLTDTSIELFYNFFEKFFRYLTEKINYRLVPDYFYIYERLGRHHANNWRINSSSADIFSLFCTRMYLNYALRVHPIDKITYPLHYKIMKKINRQLFEMPTIYGKWPLQSGKVKHWLNKIKPAVRYISRFKPANTVKNGTGKKKILSAYDRRFLLETKVNEIRSVCFDNSSSELWQLINRKRLEELLCNGTEYQQSGLPQLYNIATLFYYEQLTKSN